MPVGGQLVVQAVRGAGIVFGMTMPAGDEPWFSVRCLFGVESSDRGKMYEERITLWRADSASAAIEAAEREAVGYADTRAAKWTVEYLGLAQASHLIVEDRGIESGDEVFSLLRESDLTSDHYHRLVLLHRKRAPGAPRVTRSSHCSPAFGGRGVARAPLSVG